MNPEMLSQLLQRCESDALDFKLQPYDLGADENDQKIKERKRAKLAKDILAFGNLWRDEPRYIVIGVERLPDGTINAPGVSEHLDGVYLVQALDGLVHPCPRFHYAQVELNGRQYGVIVIPADRSIGPFFASKDVGGADGTVKPLLRKHALYCRRDSSNEEASPGEQSAIWKWFQQGQSLQPLQFPPEQAWTQIVELAQLASRNCHHVLILALDESAKKTALANLTAIDWSMVIDLDPASQISGALRHFREHLSGRRALHVVTPEGKMLGDVSRTTSWYFANGQQVASDLVSELKFKDWVAKYGKPTALKIQQLASGCNGPVSILALCESPNRVLIVRKLFEDLVTNFGERATCVAVSVTADQWSTLEQQELATLIPMSVGNFLDGLAAQARVAQMGAENVVQLPGVGGVPKDISGENFAYLDEDLELVHISAGTRALAGIEPMREFLRGGQISWFDLGLQADVEREKTADLLRMVEQDLGQRGSTRINLYHEPGAGGSTIARRVLWILHQRHPTVVLRRCSARETVERIALVYQLTGQSILVLREGSDVPESEADQLANLLASKHVPYVLLQVLRRYQPPNAGKRSIFLPAQLSTTETERFRASYEREAPTRKHQIAQLASVPTSTRTPFLFGLTAFAAEFTGLTSYVQNHLSQLPAPQIRVLQFLALSYDYGQQALAAAHFAEHLQLPPTRPVDFGKVLCNEARGLLIEQGGGCWRPVHQLVSTEILELTLSTDGIDKRLWKMQLGDLARQFVDFCRTNEPVPPDDLQDAIEQVCVRRNDAELLSGAAAGESRFSRLVSDLPTTDAKLRLFEHLVEVFPENPHFWAHLGRYHSIERKDFGSAEKAINQAISLSEDDHVLHHMKGMALRNLAFQMIGEKESVSTVVAAAKRASESFGEARRLAPDDDYGYIAEAQAMLRVLDYARNGQDAVLVLTKENTDPWLMEGFERIENLLGTVREQRRGEPPSEHEDKCRAELDVLYGAHDQALQRWDQLLQRKGANGQSLVHAPPIRRQIVWLQLARCERQWQKLSPKHLQRSLTLLEENIQQEPNEDRNIRLWLQGARFLLPPPTLALAADRVATWRTRGDSLDAIYYLYVLKTLDALDGSAIAANDAQRNIEICKAKAGFRRDRTRSFEWLGGGEGLRRLVHQDQLGGWDDATGFWLNTKPLLRIEGVVSRIHAPQSGEIELRRGIKAFFAPAVAGMALGRDENRRVSFYLGFSYEGLRAWSVTAS
jgi:tetratricopeptide (TPR) repeat protein